MSNWKILNEARITPKQDKFWGTTPEDGFNGAFAIVINGMKVKIIASDQEGWQHVSVSLHDQPNMTPSWSIMNLVKGLFWNDDEAVMQLHPPKSDYINNHPGCLHLWRPLNEKIPMPPWQMVGVKEECPAPAT